MTISQADIEAASTPPLCDSPKAPFFDKSWRPGGIEPVK